MKFSFIIIAHNQENEICNAICSALNQTYTDVEVIFVDDASTDSTLEVVANNFHDDRLKVVPLNENQGILTARMVGADHATGDWILFMDGDDCYNISACEILANTIKNLERSVDLIAYGTQFIYDAHVLNPTKVDLEENLAAPHLGYRFDDEIMEDIILTRRNWNMWNKCYSSALMKKVNALITREYLFYAEDYYFNFIACDQAKVSYSISDALYFYSVGNGITTIKVSSLEQFKRQMLAVRCHDLVRLYASENGIDEKYSSYLAMFYRNAFFQAFNTLRKMHVADKTAAAKLLFETYGARYALAELANSEWLTYELAEELNIREIFSFKKRSIRTVGMYYQRLHTGGAERVMALLTEILYNAGYRVILFTDEEPNDADFYVPVGTPRVVLGSFNPDISNNGGYGTRFDRIVNAIKTYEIDVIINHAWCANPLFYDMCAAKNAGAGYIIYSHNVFLEGLNRGSDYIISSGPIYRHADAMVTLNEVDRMYWSKFNPRIFCVTNPMTFDPSELPTANLTGHNILWAGRFDPEQKNPHDALCILSKVLQFVPDAKLFMLGTGDADVVEELHDLAKELNIEDRVEFTGFVKDIEIYLLQSSVFLFTSNYEGFGMVFAEALSYGVPCVTYPIPYVSMIANSEAAIQVPWKNYDKAAEAIAILFENNDDRFEMGRKARKEALDLKNTDYEKMWSDILDVVGSDIPPVKYSPSDEIFDIFYETSNIGLRQASFFINSYMQKYEYICKNKEETVEWFIRNKEETVEWLTRDKEETVEWLTRDKEETVEWLNSQHEREVSALHQVYQKECEFYRNELNMIRRSGWYRLGQKIVRILNLFRHK